MTPSRRQSVALQVMNFKLPVFLLLLGLVATSIAGDGDGMDCSLIGFWRFDGAKDSVVADHSPLGNDAKIVQGEIHKDGRGGYLALDGIEGKVVIPGRSPFQLKQGSSISLWTRLYETRTTHLFGIRNRNEDWITPDFGLAVVSGHVLFAQPGAAKGDSPLLMSKSVVPTGRWLHLVATADGEGQHLYFDGCLDAEVAHPITFTPLGGPLQIGVNHGPIANLRADIGELRLYDRALTGEEVAALFKTSRANFSLPDQPAPPSDRDHKTTVETHGTTPADSKPWVSRPSRWLEGLDGFRPPEVRPTLSRFGGCMDFPREQATGFFRTQRIGDRWWLIDPDGWRFFSIGLNAVRNKKDDPAWAESTTEMLRHNGFNTTGMWSNEKLLRAVKEPLALVERKDFIADFARKERLMVSGKGSQGFIGVDPVFEPAGA